MSDQDGTLEERLRRLEDKDAIGELFLAYRRALDEKDFPAYAALFAAEGEFIAGDMRARGPAAIQKLVEGMLGTLLTSESGNDLHVVANPEIELEGDRARARTTWIYILRSESGGPSLCKVGHYDDNLVREGGAWRFLSRDAPTDMPA
jgi:3-phenylpropionate/cinnamic acid dioxygenase small subunit